MLKIGQLAQIKSESTYIYEALTQIVSGVNAVGLATGVDPSGRIDPPARWTMRARARSRRRVGTDFKNGLAKILPFIGKGLTIAQAAEPYVSLLDPAVGTIFQTTVATVSSIEQKFAALNQATGTGPQKLAEATTILQPVISQAFAAAGKPADATTVENYISAVVGFLNAIPASTAAPAPAATPAPANLPQPA